MQLDEALQRIPTVEVARVDVVGVELAGEFVSLVEQPLSRIVVVGDQ